MWQGKSTVWGTPTCLSGNTTVTLKSDLGCLHAVVINTKGNSGSLLKLYDSLAANGNLIASIDLTITPITLTYDCLFFNGLTAVLTAGSIAPNVTLIWM